MFESTLSAQALSEGERRLGPLSAAVAGHVALVMAIVGVTALIVPPVTPPEPRSLVFVTILQPPEFVHERPGGPQRARKGTDDPGPKQTITPQPPPQLPPPPQETLETPPPAIETAELDSGDGSEGDGHGPPGVRDGSDSDLDAGDGAGGGPHGPNGGPIPFSAEMVTPVLLQKVEPVYPNTARIARLGGRVTVQAVIGLDGRVESAEILASTSPLFDEAARSAVLQWRYRPALMNGRPVRIYFTVVVQFSIR